MGAIVANARQGYRKVNPLFVPKLLINLGAGHISMKHGFTVRTTAEHEQAFLAHYYRAPVMRQQLPVPLAPILSVTRPGSLHAAMQM